MFSHVTIGSKDPDKAAAFYDAVLKTLGIEPFFKAPGLASYGTATGPKVFILKPFDGGPHAPGNGGHVAFLAPNRPSGDAVHATAPEHGGSDERAPGPPTPRPPNSYPPYAPCPESKHHQPVCKTYTL